MIKNGRRAQPPSMAIVAMWGRDMERQEREGIRHEYTCPVPSCSCLTRIIKLWY